MNKYFLFRGEPLVQTVQDLDREKKRTMSAAVARSLSGKRNISF